MIHPTAIIDQHLILGAGSKIWCWTHVRDHVVIGNETNIGDHCYIGEEVEIGDYCKIANAVNIYKGVTIANRVFVGQGTQFINDRHPRIGEDSWKIFKIKVEDDVSIGAGCIIMGGVTLHEGCTIGAGTTVLADVDAGETVVGIWKGKHDSNREVSNR